MWEMDLIESENMTGTSTYIFNVGGEEYGKEVPNTITANFWDL